MKSFFGEFKAFALRGNVLDLAVGVVIGGAFAKITDSLVTNIITPPIGLLVGKVDFKDLAVNLGGTVTINYGLFLQALIDFIIIAFVLFLFIRFINRITALERHKKPQPEDTKSPELVVLEEIRDSIRNRLG